MAAKRFKVLTGLRYPADATSLKKALAGETEGLNWKVAKVGSVVDDIPAVSLPWLLEQGKIQELKPGEPSEEKEG